VSRIVLTTCVASTLRCFLRRKAEASLKTIKLNLRYGKSKLSQKLECDDDDGDPPPNDNIPPSTEYGDMIQPPKLDADEIE
jgi:hypothetical protein